MLKFLAMLKSTEFTDPKLEQEKNELEKTKSPGSSIQELLLYSLLTGHYEAKMEEQNEYNFQFIKNE